MSMQYSVFNQVANDATLEPMFLGNPVNVSRYDIQKHPIFEKLIDKQLSFFWRPEEIDITKDRLDYVDLQAHEQHIFLSNLRYQTLLDSIQGRSPNIALLPLISIPELETWVEVWSAFETIHSRSYTHIIRNIINEPSLLFNDIVVNEEIIKRAKDIAAYYDDVIEYSQYYNLFGEGTHVLNGKTIVVKLRELKRKIYMCLNCVNALEAIRFYVSFACSFAFAERKLMEGNAKIIKLIARDEAIHMNSTQTMINLLNSGKDDYEFAEIAEECKEECIELFRKTCEQEMAWADYLFKDGTMIGLNSNILSSYVQYLANIRMRAIDLPTIYPEISNPLPWMDGWLVSDNVQVAPQETEITSYLVGQIDASLDENAFDDFVL